MSPSIWKRALLATLLAVGLQGCACAGALPESVNGQALPSLAPMLERVTPAVVNITTKRKQKIDESILNVNGGAIALGHPVGMSGARIVLTALKELKRRDKNRALATLCIGGGQGAAFLLEI